MNLLIIQKIKLYYHKIFFDNFLKLKKTILILNINSTQNLLSLFQKESNNFKFIIYSLGKKLLIKINLLNYYLSTLNLDIIFHQIMILNLMHILNS